MSPLDGESTASRDGSAPVVSVIIPHMNDIDNLHCCLDLLGRQTFPSGTFEVVVADNGSASGLEAVRAVVGSRARTIRAEKKGAAQARNVAVTQSRGAILAFIDSDCRPGADWLAEGVAGLDSYDVVGGAIRVEVADPDNMTPTEAFEVVFAFRNAMYIRNKGFTVTASMFVRRDVFDAVGPFRVGVSEDVDWCHRARRLGYRLGYADQAVVGHPARRTWADLRRKSSRLTSESYELYREISFGQMLWLMWTWLLPVSIIPHLLYIFTTRKLSRFRDRLNAAQVLARIRLVRFVEGNRLALTRNVRIAARSKDVGA
jgi:glycosyltransferase involved in cell wall biosynthesis